MPDTFPPLTEANYVSYGKKNGKYQESEKIRKMIQYDGMGDFRFIKLKFVVPCLRKYISSSSFYGQGDLVGLSFRGVNVVSQKYKKKRKSGKCVS